MGEQTALIALVGVILQLIFLEGILSIDNAAVLGAMVAHLPKAAPIPWPRPLRPLGRLLDPLLGPQRAAALKVGLLGAYLGRGLMLLMASVVIRNPWLQLVGALYLIRLATEHLGTLSTRDKTLHNPESAGPFTPTTGRGFWSTVLRVELADLAFSLDNVVVAVTISRNFFVVMTGVALGILTMRFAASVFTRLIDREPVLATAAYILVLNIGLEFLLHEFAGVEIGEGTRFAINVATLLLSVVYAHLPRLQVWLHRPLRALQWFFYYLNRLISWVLWPVGWVARGVWTTALTAATAFHGGDESETPSPHPPEGSPRK